MNGNVLAGLAVTAHNNAALNTSTFTNVSLSSATFGVYRELWTNLSSSVGNNLAALTNTTDNPNWPTNPAAAYTHVFTNFETEINDGMDYFGQRLRAFVVPPANGAYSFWIASDDTSVLYLSTNENPAVMAAIASVTSYTSSEDWTNFASQQSAAINLQAGCRYYLEARMQQGTGGENLSVRWQLPNGAFEGPMTADSAAGTLLIPCNGVNTPPGIFAQSTNISVVENQAVTYSLLVTNGAAVSYQWRANGSVLAGATLPVYLLSNASLALNNGQVYTCVVSNSVGSVTSSPITLTVLRDTVPPAITEVFNVGPTNVEIVFSKPIAVTNATNVANYSFTNGLSISGAALAVNNYTVTLTTASLVYGSNYEIVVNNIRDLASTPNTIASNTLVVFAASPFAPQDIGSPALASTDVYTGAGVSISSAGYSIGGGSDQFNLDYQLQSGNFDVSVCLAGLGLSDLWAQAGLMARANLTPGSPFAAALATPGMNGDFFEARATTNGQATTAGSFPANYPDTWLRLNRVGNVFTGFGSYDGTNWTQVGSATIAMPAQIYLGLAVASHSAGQFTSAQFVNYQTTPTNAVVAPVANPHEPISPSSRKTGIVISEIMWKPAPRTDTNNVEFLELYNSCPFFQDISGYQVTCADMNYTFPTNTLIPGGAYFVLAASPQSIANVYGLTTNVFGPYTGSLKHSETLELLDEQTNVLLAVPYNDTYPWPVAADGTGHSIVLANPSYGEGDPRAWDISDVVGGSPGEMEAFRPSPLRSVVINEILPHSENPAPPQFIELYNHSTNRVDVSGCILTDDPGTNKFVIPAGTLIGPAGFLSFTQAQFGFTLNGAGETLYFIKPDGSRILDAVQFGGQPNGVSYGRWPDGANDFYNFTTNTPGTNNSSIVIGDVVINELMYDPISGNDDDQYIELFNKGTNTMDLSGWQFTAGVTFTFPSGTTLAPNGYVVVARNLTNLFALYPNLNTGNTVGNYSGKLSHNGELVVLAMPQTLYGTNTIYVEEDEVTYGTGGRWGEWSSGGGSSLELIDPHANHRLASNWADSDETQKSSWVDIENTGVLDNGGNYEASILHAQIGLLDEGECLVDNIEVDYNGSNYVSNGTFDGGLGLTNWSLQGCMTRSALENGGYSGSQYSLHIRSSDRLWTGDNSCQVALNTNSLAAGQTVTLRFKARWLHGWPEALLRLNGNWLEATAAMPVPSNLGSPGAPNSQYLTNAGPAIYNVTHTPSLPAANQAVVVTAQAHDPDGIQSLTLYYRLDPATNYTAVPMNDRGTGGDTIAGDGIFSATIPGESSNTLAAFYITATDSLGAATRFPALRPNDNEPVRECLVLFGDGNPGGSFGVYHLWITQSNATRWANLSDLSNEGNDCTFVNGPRVIYNMQGRFAGSPYHQEFNTPAGNLCHYKWEFNDDDKFLGATDFNKIHQPGNGPGDDASLQREELANTFLRALGAPWLYKRLVAVYVNGNRRGTLMEDTQVPDSDIVKEHFPNDAGGFLYKMQPWFEMAPFPSGATMSFSNASWCNLMPYTTTGGAKKPARYRYSFEIRRTPDSDSDFTNVFSLVDAAGSYSNANYVANMENLANMDEWMRVFAANHAAGNWDSFGCQNAQNLYGYIGTLGTKYTLLMWDFNIVIGNSGSWGPGQDLFGGNSQDPNTENIYNNPSFLRMYWRALQELVDGPLNVANSGPLLMAKYNAFTENGLSVEDPTVNIEPWLSQAQSSIAAQLTAVNATNFSVNDSVLVSNNMAYISGVAPVAVASVWINGVAWPVIWTSLTNWVVAVPLQPGTNQFNVSAVDHHNNPIAGDSGSVSAVFNGQAVSPLGQVVINEIMYAPFVPGASFLELYNNSANTTFNLSGWQVPELAYTFPSGAALGPGAFLVLANNLPAFAGAYGATNTVFDLYSGALQPGQPLTLLAPLGNGSSNLVVAEVEFDSAPPWPTNANGTGCSLQLIDPLLDNWRVGNWAVATNAGQMASPGTTNAAFKAMAAFRSLWLNEVEAENLTGPTNSAGQRTPWLELYNPSTNTVLLGGLYLADNYTNFGQWSFPANASIQAGQFLVIFVDGQTNLSTTNELHTSFVLSPSSGALALSRYAYGQWQVMDYLNYTNLLPNYSYGSFPDGQSFVREVFAHPTPGGTNDGTALPPPSFVPYLAAGSVYTQNFDALPDPGSTSVNSDNPVTINGITYALSNPFDFAYPVSAGGNDGGLGLAALAGWYGLADPTASVGVRFGATDGDQTTGGQISFGLPNSSNRALGLLATSTTGYTAFGLKLVNGTSQTLNFIDLQFTGEVWRQSNLPKTLQFYYFIDPTAADAFSTAATAYLPALNVNFPTVSGDVGGAAVEGTSSVNQTNLNVTNQLIAPWTPGSALWLVWEMASATGKSQGLGIDNLSFSASVWPGGMTLPPLGARASGTNLLLSCPSFAGLNYQVQYRTNLLQGSWRPLGAPIAGTGGPMTFTNSLVASPQGYYRLSILP
jgi:regulation of enolase protein 1 (concanavalin A-like superfamily)